MNKTTSKGLSRDLLNFFLKHDITRVVIGYEIGGFYAEAERMVNDTGVDRFKSDHKTTPQEAMDSLAYKMQGKAEKDIPPF